MKHSKKCPECGGTEIYKMRVNGSGAMDLLPHLGGMLNRPQFEIFVCSNCGYCRWFVAEEIVASVSEKWSRHR